jgi:23S rRNA (guanosine2251-2'-O)-methyltransferase
LIVYGINAVAEALRAGRVRQIRVAGRDDDRLRRLLEAAAAGGVPVEHVRRDLLEREARGGRHQGVVADVAARPEATLEDLSRPERGPALVVVLDGVEDPQNVGAILRSVDAAGGTGVVRQTRRAAPLDGAAAKASAGAVHHVRVADVVNIARALDELKDWGCGSWGWTRTAKPLIMIWISPRRLRWSWAPKGTDSGVSSASGVTSWPPFPWRVTSAV